MVVFSRNCPCGAPWVLFKPSWTISDEQSRFKPAVRPGLWFFADVGAAGEVFSWGRVFPCRRGQITSKIETMAKVDKKTTMVADGLRYKSKVSGSPFTAATSFGAATMSCFMCGKHRPRSQLMSRKILGKSQAVCSPSCKVLGEANS